MKKAFYPGRELTIREKIVLGVSGGVDSCAAALLLLKNGYDPVAVRLVLNDKNDEKDRLRLEMLKSVGIRLVELDGRDLFVKSVIEPFLAAYRESMTPNPCVLCNEKVKFKMLFDEADRLGINHVATGHYAGKGLYGCCPAILRATSSAKDQSYMLYRLLPDWISRLVFPLSDISKGQVRDMVSSEFGSKDMGEGDSQDICFLDGGLDEYLKERVECLAGAMVSVDGEVLGKHRGLCLYTEGQRKGLGLGGGPWFVVRKDSQTNALVLGRERDSLVVRVGVSMINWQQEVPRGFRCQVQYRYRSLPRMATIYFSGENGEVLLESPAGGVAPGQSVVFYDGPCLLGGGIITWTADS